MKQLILAVAALFMAGGAQASGSCTNFSGFWRGVCEDNLGTVDKSFFAIEQAADCSALHYGPHPVNFGVTNTATWNGGNTTRVDNIDWNDPNNMQFLTGTVDVTNVVGPDISASITISKTSWRRMVFELQGTVDLGDGNSLPFQQTCRYRKAGRINGDL